MTLTPSELAAVIDHTLLKPEATEHAVVQLCLEAQKHRFASVCVQPCRVEIAYATLAGSGVPVCTVIGFPHGANLTATKVFEAGQAIRQGATELDMVIPVGAVKSEAWQVVEADIEAVVRTARQGGATVKVILECALLDDAEKRVLAEITAASGAAFVKTSTGYGPHGATVEDVRLLRTIVGARCGVKAAGGIRNLETAIAMLDAGASRLGTSAGIALLTALESRS